MKFYINPGMDPKITTLEMIKAVVLVAKDTGNIDPVNQIIKSFNYNANNLEILASVLFDLWSEDLGNRKIQEAYERCMEALRAANLREALE